MSFLIHKNESLVIKNERKRIFVTQLRDDEEDELFESETNSIIQKIPIVKEKAGQLIELGYNTDQKTLLLKRQADVNKVDHEFRQKKDEFSSRMRKCKEHEQRLKLEREKLTERIKKFQKFINENDAKRSRALVKYEKETKLKCRKEDELFLLKQNVKNLQKRLSKLKVKISKYQIYEKYLISAVDMLPEDYLESTDNLLVSLMQRYQTLNELNENMLQYRDELNLKIKEHQQSVQEDTLASGDMLMLCNKELAEWRDKLEKARNRNKEMETKFAERKEKFISASEELGEILLSIDNLSSFCAGKQTDVNVRFSTPQLKLDLINVYYPFNVRYIDKKQLLHHLILEKLVLKGELEDQPSCKSILTRANFLYCDTYFKCCGSNEI